MTELVFSADRSPDARTALARGAGTLLAAAPGRAVLYGAIASDPATVLGRWQRREDPTALRRATGGPPGCIGPGVLYLALGLHGASALMACPRDKVLNRNVRGFLGGLSMLAGEPVLHFGREWLSRSKTPVALVSWHRDLEDRVLVEVLASISPVASKIGAPFAPPRDFRGHAPGSVSSSLEVDALVEVIARGHASRFPGLSITRSDALPAPVAPPPERDADVTRWSSAHEIPIGTLTAGLELDAAGRVARARLAGDFYADEVAITTLERELVGHPPDEIALGSIVDRTLASGGVEGLRSSRPILDALLEAAHFGATRSPS